MAKVNDNQTFLLDLYKEVNKKIKTIQIFSSVTKNKLLKEEFVLMLDNYRQISAELSDYITRKNISEFNDNMLGTMIISNLKILFNKKSSHISSVILDDNIKTIIKITRMLNKHKQLPEILKLYATESIRVTENASDVLKPFLK